MELLRSPAQSTQHSVMNALQSQVLVAGANVLWTVSQFQEAYVVVVCVLHLQMRKCGHDLPRLQTGTVVPL